MGFLRALERMYVRFFIGKMWVDLMTVTGKIWIDLITVTGEMWVDLITVTGFTR